MIQAILFDFDGVILDSARLKTDAFRKMFAEHSNSLDEIMAYHCSHMGVSRYVKFKYIYENILNKSYTTEIENKLAHQFEEIVYDSVLAAPFIVGAHDFLEVNSKRWACFVVSGTPEKELNQVCRVRGLMPYFREIHGSPRIKKDIVKDILDRHKLNPGNVLFVGDAETDRDAAETNLVHFLGCGSGLDQFSKPVRLAANLTALEEYILKL